MLAGFLLLFTSAQRTHSKLAEQLPRLKNTRTVESTASLQQPLASNRSACLCARDKSLLLLLLGRSLSALYFRKFKAHTVQSQLNSTDDDQRHESLTLTHTQLCCYTINAHESALKRLPQRSVRNLARELALRCCCCCCLVCSL